MFLSFELFGIPKSGFDPEKTFVQSHFVSPLALAGIRALIALYCFTTIIVCYAWQANHPTVYSLKDVNINSYTIINGSAAIGQSFSFFTYLTFWSLGFYFAFASVHTFMFAFKQRTWLHQWSRWLQLTHSLYYSTVTCFPFLVTIVFWGTMYSGPWPEQSFVQWINISVHGLNSFFALVEIVLPAVVPPALAHLSIVLLILSIYLGLVYLTKYTQGFYVYEWMNPVHGNASIILHILGYAVGMIALFFVSWGLIKLRELAAKKLAERQLKAAVEKKIGSSESTSSVDVNNVV